MKKHPKILTIILAGGQGGRMGTLTAKRAKPVLPFAGAYRLIDFALSNCAHSHIRDVWIVEQYQPFELNAHLANGRPWDLDRLHGGLRLLPPYETRDSDEDPETGFADGNADALWRNRRFIRDFDPDLLLVLSADHVYRLDFRDVVEGHLSRADSPSLTLVYTSTPAGDDARRFGSVRINEQTGKIEEFAYKPEVPLSNQVTTEVFLYDAQALLHALDELSRRAGTDENEGTLKDFGHELLPHLVSQGNVYGFPLEGYWRDVGTPDSYMAAHTEFLRPQPPFALDDPEWPILTFALPRSPARIGSTGKVTDSLISPGCRIEGSVERSVLSPGVIVETGATVRDAIVFDDAIIREGALVERSVVDEDVEVGAKARVGGPGSEPTLVGRGLKVAPGENVEPGKSLPPPGSHE